uniref:Tektin bundle interacting protein 1 n=1 Tax=Meleagris gallopavo TaxID=9103 RepID=A0A803YKP9_MELGA
GLGMKPGVHRAWVPQSTLETDFPLPLGSEQYVTLRGPRCAPVVRQAVRWKMTPLGRDAAGQSWTSGTASPMALPGRGAGRCPAARPQLCSLFSPPQVYDQHLREVACWDPTVPAAYPGPGTRWGAFLWQECPILGKEYVATRSQSTAGPGGSSGYVPLLSFCSPQTTARDVCTWSLLQHQPSTSHK